MPTKRVPDTDQKIEVQADGLAICDAHLPFIVNPFDSIAVEEALQIKDRLSEEVEVAVVGIGTADYESELRTSLAMGADRAILIECDQELDPWNVSRVLREVVSRESPELVLMGKQAVDDDSNQVGQFLAALLDWPQATFASKVEFTEGGLRVSRETDLGIEIVVVGLPAVVTTDLRLNEPRYASLPSILRAKKKSIDRVPIQELELTLEPRISVRHLQASAGGRECRMVTSAEELLEQLRSKQKVL